MAQIITPQKAKLGPDNNTTAYIYIYTHTGDFPIGKRGFEKHKDQNGAQKCCPIFGATFTVKLGENGHFLWLQIGLGPYIYIYIAVESIFWPSFTLFKVNILAKFVFFKNNHC